MPASLAATSRGRPSRALASASRRALTRPSRSRRAKRRSSAASWSVRIGKGAGTAASPRTMPPQRLKRPIDPSPFRPAGITITLRISVERHVHVGLPDGIPDIDIGDTYDLGSFDFSMPVGDIVIPGLNNLNFHIPSLTAQNLSVAASPVGLQLHNVSAEQIRAVDVALPAAGFTLAGLTLGTVAGSGIGVPAAQVGQA